MRTTLITALLLALTTLAGHAQADSVSIRGTVWLLTHPGFVPRVMAQVKLRNTGQVVEVDSTGLFQFNNLPAGTYILEVRGDFTPIDTIVQISSSVSRPITILLDAACEVNEACAERDIAIGKPRLLLASGMAPVVYTKDQQFAAAYDVLFYDFGCVSPRYECMVRYNQRTFAFLDRRYGPAWRRQMRKGLMKELIGVKRRRK